MPIYVRDETANALVLTIDNSGNMCFADGTPIDLLTLDGYGIIDSGGHIVHGLGSSAVAPTSGSVRVPTNHVVDIATISGRTPTVFVDTTFPAYNWNLVADPGNPDVLNPTSSPISLPVHSARPFVGGFRLVSNTFDLSGQIIDPGSDHYNADLAAGELCTYRWL